MAICLIMTAIESKGQRRAINDDLITVDVRKSYSSKKELILQDFMDVEYIALETNNDFLNQGIVRDIGKENILVTNQFQNNDGDIFVYDRTGKAKRKLNRKGQGPEEYLIIYGIVLDEDNGEMFVSDILNRKIFVYDLDGKYKRSFNQKDDSNAMPYLKIFNYDRDNLICYDDFNKELAFVLISKLDGSITKEIKIQLKERRYLRQISRNDVNDIAGPPGPTNLLKPYNGNWILSDFSSDTVYTFLPNYNLSPLFVRTPSIQSMNPEVMLIVRLFSDRYYFMETIKNEYNFDTRSGFARTFFMYDRFEKGFSGYSVYNGDYSSKKEIYMNTLSIVNHEIESCQKLEAFELVESYKKGILKGKLKEIASKLDEEDNPVIMLIKHKK